MINRVPTLGWRKGAIQVPIATGSRALFRAVSPLDKTGVTYIGPGYVTADGRYYAYSYNRQISELFVVEGLK